MGLGNRHEPRRSAPRKKKRVDPRILVWAWGAIEADFLRFYKMDLIEEGLKDTLTWRRFMVLLRNLPSESAFATWMKDKEKREYAEWDQGKLDEQINERKSPRKEI